MLADELDRYKDKGNKYVDNNIKEIQDLYMEEEIKKDSGKVEDEEVILIKPYKVSSLTSISTHSMCYGLKPLVLDNRTTLVLSNTRKLNRDLFTN